MYCKECGKKIYEGDIYYEINGEPICIDCAIDYLDENCLKEDEDGEFYEVDGIAYETDEVGSLLNACKKILEHDDEESDPRYEPEYWKDR